MAAGFADEVVELEGVELGVVDGRHGGWWVVVVGV